MRNLFGILSAVLLIGCGGVDTVQLAPDGGDDGGEAGAGGAGGAASCAPGGEACSCYGNDTCNDGLTCLSHLCVAAGGRGGMAGGQAGGGGSAGSIGRGGIGGAANTTGAGNTTGQGGTTGTGNTTGTGGAMGTGGAGGSCAGTDMLCGTSCVNTNTSIAHCGGCNRPCSGTCSGGVCSTGKGGAGGVGGHGGTGGGAAWYCPGGTDVACITDDGVSRPCTAKCTLGQNQRGTQPDGTACTCFFHATGTGNYTECPPDSYCS
jgi:hypothetical protein